MADLRCHGRPTLNSRALDRYIKGDRSCAGSIILVCGAQARCADCAAEPLGEAKSEAVSSGPARGRELLSA